MITFGQRFPLYRLGKHGAFRWHDGSAVLRPGWFTCPVGLLRAWMDIYARQVEAERLDGDTLRWTAVLPPQMPGMEPRVAECQATGVESVAALVAAVNQECPSCP